MCGKRVQEGRATFYALYKCLQRKADIQIMGSFQCSPVYISLDGGVLLLFHWVVGLL